MFALKEVMLQGTNGLAKRVVEQKYPNLPPQVGCAVMYWLDAPAVARQMETPEHANTPPQPPMLQDEERRTALQREHRHRRSDRSDADPFFAFKWRTGNA